MGRRKESITERRREVIPLTNLDNWLDFAESLLGTQNVPHGVVDRGVRVAY